MTEISLLDIERKYGTLDNAIDAYLDRKMTKREDGCFTWHAGYISPAIQRRIYERQRGKEKP